MRRDQTELPLGLIVCCLCVWGVVTQPALAEDAPQQPNETKAVFRISKQFLHDVAGKKEIVADIPLCAIVLGFHCTGTIHGHGKVSVDLQSSSDQAVFAIDSQGDGHACVAAVRGPIVAIGPAWGPFTSRTLVSFDGRRFAYVSTAPCVTVHGELQRVTNRRDGPVGRGVGRVVKPLAKPLVPHAEAQGKPIGEYYLVEFIEELADRIIARLNEKTPVGESVNRLFPHTKDWVFRVSADAQFIQAAFGPPGAGVPPLPDFPGRIKDARVEVWLRSTNQEAKLLEGLSKRPLAKQLVQKYLESTLPKLAALAEERTVAAIGSWVVISVGAPKTD